MSRWSIFGELKRRHVYKVGAAYAVGGWLLVQVATQVLPVFNVPNAWLRWIVVIVALGFPVALIVSWIFDLTPEGFVRTDDAAADETPRSWAARQRFDRKLNYVLGGLLMLCVVYLLVDRFALRALTAPADENAQAASQPSIAVLAFADMSEGSDQGYFADGISEELLNLLAQVPQLHVAGRTSSFSFKGKTASVKEIGAALNVSSVLEGGVRKVGDRLRVTAQLINVDDGFQLWSQTYDRKLDDIFAVQDDIADSVVDALKFKLLPSRAKQYAPNFETYDHFLLGRQLLVRGDDAYYPKAVDAFNQAIALDPNYAEAYAGLAMAESFVGEGDPDRFSQQKAFARAMIAANKAVELGPSLGDAFAARGYLRGSNDWDWDGALNDLHRAVALDPGDARNQLRYGYLLASLGRLTDATRALTVGTSNDPLFSPAWFWLGRIRAAQGNFPGAILALHRTLAIDPEYTYATSALGVVALLQGDAVNAHAIFKQLGRQRGLAMTECTLGNEVESQRLLAAIADANSHESPYGVAAAYAWCGQTDQAFAWLNTAIEHRDPDLQSLKYDPLLRSIRSDPRYSALLKVMNLPTGDLQ